jgi:formate C-acetyltransferase
MKLGKDITAGGAHYNFTSPQGVGVADVADSIAALDTLVFKTGACTMGQIVDAMKNNFQGQEVLRQQLIHGAPKFGNDDDYVDEIARFVGRQYCQEVEKYRNPRGGIYNPGLYPVSAHVPLGKNTGAMPSGRKAKTPLADGVSPTHGSDTKGPTGVINSVGKLDHVIASNGTLLNQKFHPTVLDSPKGIRSLAGLIGEFFARGGKHIQFNVVDAATLREAQKHPENHVGLVVRVAGYSAFFTQLSADMQNDIIERTEHKGF